MVYFRLVVQKDDVCVVDVDCVAVVYLGGRCVVVFCFVAVALFHG